MVRTRSFLVLVALVTSVLLVAAGCLAAWDERDQSAPPGPSGSDWQPGDPTVEPPLNAPDIVGVNYHPLWDEMDSPSRRNIVLDQVSAAGVGWVRLDIGWGNIQPDGPASYDLAGGVRRVDERVAEARRRGLRVLLLFAWAPKWATGTEKKNGRPRDPAQYAAAAAWVADRYSGRLGDHLKIDAIELWNEPDLERFWAQQPRATRVSDFADLVRVSGAEVKKANPQLTVVAGAISALDAGWLKAFYAAHPGVGTSYDVLGLHTYPSPSDRPPDHFDLNYPQHSMLTLSRMAEIMTTAGDDAPIWITEFGWSTHANMPLLTKNWALGVTEQQQADYLVQAMRVLTAQPRVEAVFWYNAWSPPLDDEHLDGFGLLSLDFRRKPAFFVMRCIAARICGPGS